MFFFINQFQYFLGLLLGITVVVQSQAVPCTNQVLLSDQYSQNSPQNSKVYDLSNDIEFKKTTSLSVSFWMNQDAQFSITFQVTTTNFDDKLLSISATSDATQTPPIKTLEVSSVFFDQNQKLTFDIQKKWMYVFITLDVQKTSNFNSQVNAFVVDQVNASDEIDPVLKNLQLTNPKFNNFQYSTFQINLLTSQDKFKTRTIYLHRSYGIQNINSDYKNIIAMMMRDNAVQISNYLFNQDLLVQYLDDNNDFYQNNIDISKQDSNKVPVLFYKSLSFQQQSFIKLNGFRLTEVQREFTISFSIQTLISDKNPQPYTIMSLQDENNSIIFQIILKRLNEYQEQIVFNFMYQNQKIDKLINSCMVQRITQWNYFVITGYSFARLQNDYKPKKYYFDLYLDYQKCQTIVYDNADTFLNNDLFFIVFGNQDNLYTDDFKLKSLKIYSGAFSPFKSDCSSFCLIQQSKDLTNAEYKFWNDQNKVDLPSPFETPSAQAVEWLLKDVPQNQYKTESCLKCDDVRYQSGEYCLSGASKCPDGIDSSANQCLPEVLCSDPLHDSSDCIKNCIPGYQIDNAAKCSIQCGYSCAQCSSTNPTQCLPNDKSNPQSACPYTRSLVNNECQCQTVQSGEPEFFDDGISYNCIQVTQSTTANAASQIYCVFDISIEMVSNIPKPSVKTQSISPPKSSAVILLDQGVSNFIYADIDYGIQLFKKQQFFVTSINTGEASNMRFWLYTQSNLGRNLKLITYLDNSNIPNIHVILNQINNFEYSLTICLFSKCQFIPPVYTKVRANMWNQIAISIDQSKQQITVFINAFSKTFYFESFPSLSITQIKFGDQYNDFPPPSYQFFSFRYISFLSEPFYLTTPTKNNNCLVMSGNNYCILCQKGYYAKSNISFDCTNSQQPLTTQLVFSGIQMINNCGVNLNICLNECQSTPTKCKTCVQGRDQQNNCNCPEGKFSDSSFICQDCNPKCKTCDGNKDKCITCSNNRINPPLCTCPAKFVEPDVLDSTGKCVPCSSSCTSCEQGACVCPDPSKTFRIQNKFSCDCRDGYYDDTNSSGPCKKCFSNCASCSGGAENQCTKCKYDFSQAKLVKDLVGIGFCQCKDSSQYLDYDGFCREYTSVQFSLISDKYYFRPKIKIELTDGQQLENASTSKWLSLLDIKIITNDGSLHNRRNLQNNSGQLGDNNLILTVSNDSNEKNVGYINIDVQQSCFTKTMRIVVNHNTAIRTIKGVPLNPSFYNAVFEFNIQPFILKFSSDELDSFQKQQQLLDSLQNNSFFSFIRYISIPLMAMNCLSPISTLLLVNTVIPLNAHLLISQFARFVFPYTPVWINYNLNNMQSNSYKNPEYNIFGGSVNVSDQQSFLPYEQMGISTNFLVNITESLVLLGITGIFIIAFKYLDESNYKFFQGKNYYQHLISFFYSLLEVRLIYILLSIFLQFTNMNFSNALNGISAILSCLFLIGFIFFYYKTYQILNSQSEKDFKYNRLFHFVEYLDFKKHYVKLNNKLFHTVKKFFYMLVVITLYNSPNVSIIFMIIVSGCGTLLDILTSPFEVKWMPGSKIVSSFVWLAVLISLYVSYLYYSSMKNSTYIIDSSTLNNYLVSGNFIYYLVWIYFSLYCFIFLLKFGSNLNRIIDKIKNRESLTHLFIEQLQSVNESQDPKLIQIPLYQYDSNPIQNNAKIITQFKPNILNNNYFLFKNRKDSKALNVKQSQL